MSYDTLLTQMEESVATEIAIFDMYPDESRNWFKKLRSTSTQANPTKEEALQDVYDEQVEDLAIMAEVGRFALARYQAKLSHDMGTNPSRTAYLTRCVQLAKSFLKIVDRWTIT